jgi:hypothetical protein
MIYQAASILAVVPVWVGAVIDALVAGWYIPGDIGMVCVVNARVVVLAVLALPNHRRRCDDAFVDE